MGLHAFLVSIQASIDIANHPVAACNSRRPETYWESFAILCDEELIPEDLAGFRNIRVHLYCRLNPDEVSGVLQDDLPVLEQGYGTWSGRCSGTASSPE